MKIGGIVGLLILSLAAPVHAKCGWVLYEVSVTVRERGSVAPLAGVDLVFFRLGHESALPIDGERRGLRATTNEAGEWHGRLRFETYSGSFPTDRCRAKLEDLEIVATPADRTAERVRFRKLQSSKTEERFILRLEPLIVELFP
jgi:hypothetical protein